MKNLLRKKRGPIATAILVMIISIFIILFSSKILYDHTVQLLTENLRSKILTISITSSTSINYKDLEVLNSEDDIYKPEWKKVVGRLNKIKYANKDIVFIYIFRKQKNNPIEMEFVADADSIDPYANTSGDPSRYIDVNGDGKVEPDGPDKLQWPGQDYPEANEIPEAFEAYNGPLTSRDIYTDSYGSVITGYAPIKDDDGNVVAILATDVKADDFFTITRQTLQPFLIFIVFLAIIISLLIVFIIYTWKKHDDSLEKLNKKIKENNEKLQELDQMKSEFLSLATHQIRSPLTAIKGYSSMLLEGDYDKLPIKAKEPVSIIMASCQHLIDTVANFLNIANIEQGKMVYNKEIFNIKPFLEETLKEIIPNIEKAGLTFSLHISENGIINVNADKNKVSQIIHNLVDNAIKYTPKGSITVSLLKEGGVAEIIIKDTGVGIDSKDIHRLFGKFSRTKDAYKQNTAGTGLGLYIAKKMIEAQGGDIKVYSDGKGRGSTFTIELPIVNQ